MGQFPIVQLTRPSSRSSAPVARPRASRGPAPVFSIARTGSTLSATLQRVVAGVGLFKVAGEEIYGRLDVRGVDHLVRGVDVAAGNGEGDSRNTAVEALHAAGVGAAGGQYLHLVGDALAFGYPAEVLDELGMGDRVAVHDLERGALAQGRDLVLVAPAGYVYG